MTNIILPLVHPGEILREEYLEPLNMSAGRLAKLLGVPRTRIERIASEQTSISTDTAFRLAKIFQTTPEFWMNMQTSHDLKLTKDQVDVSHIDILKTA
uniref:Addiction module antidote protein, HigA family n=1 Tax=OCS116 cluster bacterium TaxID=2030921 RepID=A0A2A4Z9S6_9PROT